jgi:hypothetical protein
MLDEARRYLNDVTAALLLHRRYRRLRRKEDTVEIGPHHLPIQILGNIFDATGPPDTGIINQRINAGTALCPHECGRA